MGLFSFFRKNKQESASGQGEFLSRSAGDPAAQNSRGGRSAGNARKSSKAGKDESVDPVLPEKKRARRRLIGAVALVLAVVIVLPMILDSEPRPLADDIAIQIPSKDGKDAARDKDAAPVVDKPKAAAEPKEEFVDPATMNAGVEKPAIAPGAPAMPSGPANAPLAQAAKPAPATPAVAEKPAEKPVAKPEVKAESKAESKADVKDSKTAAKPAEHKDDHKKDVKEAAKPKAADKPDDAARALAILEGKPAAADKKPAPAAGGKFVIQVAALATQEKIDELRGKLNGAGIKSYTQKVATQSGDRTRIRVGPFASRDEADKMRAKINKLGLNATVVPA